MRSLVSATVPTLKSLMKPLSSVFYSILFYTSITKTKDNGNSGHHILDPIKPIKKPEWGQFTKTKNQTLKIQAQIQPLQFSPNSFQSQKVAQKHILWHPSDDV